MKLSRKNLNLLIERMLFEDLSEIMYDYKDGEYSHKQGDQQDPYTYKVVGGNKGTDILVKIVKFGKGTGQKLAKVGAQFKINKQKLFNPNVQSLYAAIVKYQSDYKIKGDDARRPKKGGDKAQGPRGSRPRDFVIHKDFNSLRTALALQYKNVKKGDSRLLNTENKYIEGEFTKADAIDGKASIDTVVLGTLGLKNFPSSKIAEVNNAKRGSGGFTETMSGLVDAFKPADVVYVGHLQPKISDKGPSMVYAEFLIKLDQRDFAIVRINDINFDNSKTGGSKEDSGEMKIGSEKDGPSGLGTSMPGGSMAIQESFGRSDLRNFFRGLLNESYEEETSDTYEEPTSKIEDKTSSTDKEGLSRGSLYRRRYYGRY
jgi:hypothetical protein